MTEYIPETRAYLTSFFNAKFREYFESMKELRPEHGYGFYHDHEAVTQCIRNIVNIIRDELCDLRIPQSFPSPENLICTLKNFSQLLEEQKITIQKVLDYYMEQKLPMPEPPKDIYRINAEVLDAINHVLNMEEVRLYVGNSTGLKDTSSLPLARLYRLRRNNMKLEKKLIKYLTKNYKGNRISLRKIAEELKEKFGDLYTSVVQLRDKKVIEIKEVNEVGRLSPVDVNIDHFIAPKKNIWTHPLFITIVGALIAGGFAILAAVISKSSSSNPDQSINENKGIQAKTAGENSPITNINEQNIYLNTKEMKINEDTGFSSNLAKIKISRLIEDFNLEVQSYYDEYFKETDRIATSFARRNISKSGLHIEAHQKHAKEGQKDIEGLITVLNREIEDITLETFKIKDFKTIVPLSEEVASYKKAIKLAQDKIEAFNNIAKHQEVLINQ